MSGPGAAATYFTHEQVARVIWGLVLAMFLAAMDQTVVAIALYSIAIDLRGELLMPWVVSGYLVVATVATPIHGKLSDLYGRWPVLSVAIGIYLAASVASAFAQTMPQLLAFRLLQGIGGGGLIVLVQTIIADIVPRQERGRYQAYLSGVFAVAAVSGPVVGGVLTEWLSWRAVFLFNVPLGILAWFILRRGLRPLPLRGRDVSIDYAGACLLATTLATAMIALTRLGQGQAVSDPSTAGLLVCSLVAAMLLWWRERRARDPILPPELFTNRTVLFCCLVVGLNFLLMYGCIVLVPLAMQTVGGMSAGGLAVLMLPFTLGVPLGSFISGKSMQSAMRHRLLLTLGSACSALGALALAFIALEPGWVLALALLLMGTGVGFTIPASIVAVQASVRPALIGIATATSGLFRTLGGAIGIALMSAALYAAMAASLTETAAQSTGQPGVEPGGVAAGAAAAITTTAASLSGLAPDVLGDGFRAAFLVAAAAGALAFILCAGLPYSHARPTLQKSPS